VNAYLDFLTSAILAPKSNIADEGIPSDPLTLKQQGEWIIHDLSAGTRQTQVGVTLVLGLGNGPGAPIIVFHGARDHAETYPLCPLLGRGPGGVGRDRAGAAVSSLAGVFSGGMGRTGAGRVPYYLLAELSSCREHRSAISASFKMVRRAAGVLSFFAISR
jgi:hypothetical protein